MHAPAPTHLPVQHLVIQHTLGAPLHRVEQAMEKRNPNRGVPKPPVMPNKA